VKLHSVLDFHLIPGVKHVTVVLKKGVWKNGDPQTKKCQAESWKGHWLSRL